MAIMAIIIIIIIIIIKIISFGDLMFWELFSFFPFIFQGEEKEKKRKRKEKSKSPSNLVSAIIPSLKETIIWTIFHFYF